jgi:hypothetical protein
VSGHGLYAFMAATEKSTYLLDLVHVTERPTAAALTSHLEEVLDRSCVPKNEIVAITTDTPSVMERLRREFVSKPEYKKCSSIRCGLHGLNLITQRIIKIESVQTIFRRNQQVVNYFKSSHYWN